MNQHVGNVTEVINRNVVVSLLLKQGFNVFLPVYDDGIDFIVHRRVDDSVVKIQLKSRLTIDRKYEGRGISMVLPGRGDWFMIAHDRLLGLVPEAWRSSRAWTEGGKYTVPSLSVEMAARLSPYKLGEISMVAEEAAGSDADLGSRASMDVFEELRSFRRSKSFPPLTVEEILGMRDEGRRY